MTDGIVYDKPSYVKGELITAIATIAAQTQQVDTPTTYHGTYTSADGKLTVSQDFTVHATAPVTQPVGTFRDNSGRAWTIVAGSYDGVTAKFTATA